MDLPEEGAREFGKRGEVEGMEEGEGEILVFVITSAMGVGLGKEAGLLRQSLHRAVPGFVEAIDYTLTVRLATFATCWIVNFVAMAGTVSIKRCLQHAVEHGLPSHARNSLPCTPEPSWTCMEDLRSCRMHYFSMLQPAGCNVRAKV